MKKICLLYPNEMKLPSYFRYATNILADISLTLPPMGLLYIIGNSRLDIDLIDNRVQKYDFEKLVDILDNYDVVCFSGTIFEVKQARRLSAYLMKEGKTTIYGGPNATVNWQLYLGYFNIIFRGEAEQIFDKVIENEDRLEQLGFTKLGNTYVNLRPFRITDLDSLSLPDRSRINLDDYRRTEKDYLQDVYPVDVMVSSRGCPFDCYFCSSKVIWNQKYTYRSADNLIEEMQFMIDRYQTRGLYFREDNFTTNKSRLIEFCEKAKSLNLLWLCESRVDTLDERTIELMAKAGCKGIWFGIESTDDVVLEKIRKNITLEQVQKTVNMCNEYGISSGGGFMLGFPFDDEKSIRRNYELSKKLNLKVRFYNRVYAIPRSDMYDDIINEGLDEYVFENIVLPATRGLSADRVNKLYYNLVAKRKVYRKTIYRVLGKRISRFISTRFPSLFKTVSKWFEA